MSQTNITVDRQVATLLLKVNNRSDWPDFAVRWVARWCAVRAGFYTKSPKWYRQVTLTVYNYSASFPSPVPGFPDAVQRIGFKGRNHGSKAFARINRKWLPAGQTYTDRYWSYKWSFKHVLQGRLEGLVHIIAHELYHSTGGNPRNFIDKKTGNGDTQTMEMACQRFARDCVVEFRKDWRWNFRELLQARRTVTPAKVRRPVVEVTDTLAIAAKPNTATLSTLQQSRRKHAEEKLAGWLRRAALAKTKIKQWQRKVNYYRKMETADV